MLGSLSERTLAQVYVSFPDGAGLAVCTGLWATSSPVRPPTLRRQCSAWSLLGARDYALALVLLSEPDLKCRRALLGKPAFDRRYVRLSG